MRRGVLVLVGNYLCKESTPDAFETRAAICSIRQACGRGGEVSTSVWDTAYWDKEESLVTLDWREAKTGREDLLTIGCDLHDYEICWFHSMACYMICNPGAFAKNQDNVQWLFPSFSNMVDGGASKKVTRGVKKCAGKVPGVSDKMTATCLRVGCVDDMTLNPSCHFMSIVSRGNWAIENENRVFWYATKKHNSTSGGKALAGAKDVRLVIYAARLKPILLSDNKTLVENLEKYLFDFGHAKYMDSYELVGAKSAFFATVLMYFNKYVIDHGYDNLLIKIIINKAKQFGISLKKLQDWSAAIHSDWKVRNAHHSEDVGATHRVTSATLTVLQDEIVRQADLIKNLTGKLAAVESKQDETLRLLHLLIEGGGGITKKRKQSDIVDIADTPTGDDTDEFNTLLHIDKKMPGRSLTEALMDGATTAVTVKDFPNLGQQPVHLFLKQCILQKVILSQFNCFGSKVSKQMKARGKAIFNLAISQCADEVEKKIMKPYSDRPSPTSEEYELWHDKLTSVCFLLQQRIIEMCVQSHNDGQLVKHHKEEAGHKTTVNAISNLMELVKKRQTFSVV